MGWNSWNTFAKDISEAKVMSIADSMVSNGLKDAGYQYVVIDDGWALECTTDGNIVADPQKFPNGIKHLADYVHAAGLKFGIYTSPAAKTCAVVWEVWDTKNRMCANMPNGESILSSSMAAVLKKHVK